MSVLRTTNLWSVLERTRQQPEGYCLVTLWQTIIIKTQYLGRYYYVQVK